MKEIKPGFYKCERCENGRYLDNSNLDWIHVINCPYCHGSGIVDWITVIVGTPVTDSRFFNATPTINKPEISEFMKELRDIKINPEDIDSINIKCEEFLNKHNLELKL